jgi:dolichyl-phosphate-mannose-protein mannosyltransferase
VNRRALVSASCAGLVTIPIAASIVPLDVGTLRDGLRHTQFWALELQALLVAGLTVYQWPHLLRLVRASWTHLAAVTCVSLLAFGLAAGVAPRTSRIYYDEQIYQSIAQNMTDLRLAQLCNEGTVENGRLRCARPEYNKQPNGYPYVLSLAYRVFGVRDTIAFAVNNVAAALTVWLVFFAAALWLEDLTAAVLAALVAALIPIQIQWSNTAAVEPTASLAAAASMLALASFLRSRTTLSLWWTAALTVFAAQFRPESVLLVPFVPLVIWIEDPDELRRPRAGWTAAAALALLAPLALHMVAVRGENWGTTEDRVSLSYVLGNLATNGRFYLWDARFPAFYTALAVGGVLVAGWRRVHVVVAYFAMFWGVFLVFYAGSYDFGADVRYSLMTYPPLAILAGAGAVALASAAGRLIGSHTQAMALVAGFILVEFGSYLPLVRAVGEEAWAARADVAFAREIAPTLPHDAIVLTQDPNMFQVWGINAAQMSFATTEPHYVEDLFQRFPGGVYIHWGFWCNVIDKTQNEFCRAAREKGRDEEVTSATVRDFRYIFYRLMERAGSRVPGFSGFSGSWFTGSRVRSFQGSPVFQPKEPASRGLHLPYDRVPHLTL